MRAAGDVHDMYEMSLQVVPMVRDDEEIARYAYIILVREIWKQTVIQHHIRELDR
jgi:hypothetical protein